MVMFLLSFVKGSKSAEGGPNPLADLAGGSKSARTPEMFVGPFTRCSAVAARTD